MWARSAGWPAKSSLTWLGDPVDVEGVQDAGRRNMILERVGDALFLAHTSERPTDAEWEEFVDAAAELIARTGRGKFLVLTDGGGPNATQRHAINNVCEGRDVQAAIMSDSRVVRGIVMAINWMKAMDIRPFPRDGLAPAVEFLDIEMPLPEIQERFDALLVALSEHSSERLAA